MVDTAPDLAGAVNEMLLARGLEALPIESLRAAAGHGAPPLLRQAFGITPEHPDFQSMRQEFLSNYAARFAKDSFVFPGIPELLNELQGKGIVCGAVTNKPHDLALQVCEALGLSSKLKTIIGLGFPGTALKPKPDSLLAALKELGVNAGTTLYAGDSTSDVLASHAAGIPCAWVSWGYQKEPPVDPATDFTAAAPNELFQWAMSR